MRSRIPIFFKSLVVYKNPSVVTKSTVNFGKARERRSWRSEKLIEKWYLERFDSLLKLAKYDQTNFYHQFTKMPEDKVINLAREIWARVNRVNLREYIEPTRNRAEIILHKTYF